MDTFPVSPFGSFVIGLLQGLFTAPPWQSFVLLAWGWAVTQERHTITTYLWLTGASMVKHFSRFYVFLGGALYQARGQLWTRIIRLAAQWAPPSVEAFFTTDLALRLEVILAQYRARWAVAITIRDAFAFDGLGREQCRKVARIVEANTLRLVLAAARTLWFLERTHQATGVDLGRYRPWYRQKTAPSQLDVVWTCREVLAEAGVFPIPRFAPELAENLEEPENTLPLTA